MSNEDIPCKKMYLVYVQILIKYLSVFQVLEHIS